MVDNWYVFFTCLAVAQADKSVQMVDKTGIIMKIWLSVKRNCAVCVWLRLRERLEVKFAAYLISIGTHSDINICDQLTGSISDTTYKVSCLNKAIKDTELCWVTDIYNNKAFGCLTGYNIGLQIMNEWYTTNIFDSYFNMTMLNNQDQADYAAYSKNYFSCTWLHPDLDGATFYKTAAKIDLYLISIYSR